MHARILSILIGSLSSWDSAPSSRWHSRPLRQRKSPGRWTVGPTCTMSGTTTTPLQHPEPVADRARYTEEEHAALAARAAESRGWDSPPPDGRSYCGRGRENTVNFWI